jgi:RimJ/RimL family protein N-acetyltransferase
MSTLTRSPRLLIRSIEERDFADLFRLQSDPNVMRFIRPAEPDEAVVRERIESWGQYAALYPPYGVFVLENLDNQAFVGYVVLRHDNFEPDRDIEVGYAVAPEVVGQGYASEALQALLHVAQYRLGHPHVVAYTDPANLASNRILEKAGFVVVDATPRNGMDTWLWRKKF